MAYLPNIPQSTDQLSISQGQILGNFQALLPAYTFTTNYTVPDIIFSVGPDIATAANQVALYSKTVGASADLFLRNQSNGTVFDLSFITQMLQGIPGWQKFPSGLIVKWDVVVTLRNTLATYTYPVVAGTPVFTTVYGVLATQTFGAGPSTGDLNVSVSVGNLTATTFQIFPRAIGLPNGAFVSVFCVSIGI